MRVIVFSLVRTLGATLLAVIALLVGSAVDLGVGAERAAAVYDFTSSTASTTADGHANAASLAIVTEASTSTTLRNVDAASLRSALNLGASHGYDDRGAPRGTNATTSLASFAAKAAPNVLKTPSVSNPKLQNIVNDLYKGTTNPGRVGTGTTADAVRFELRTGEQVFGKSHVQKANDSLRGLENWLKSNPNAPYQERLVARSLADDLFDALGGG